MPVWEPAVADVYDTVVEALPPAGTLITNGDAVNAVLAGAVHVTVAAAAPGFWKLTCPVAANPPSTRESVIVLPDVGVGVRFACAPAGQLNVNVTGVAVPPRLSLHVSVCVAAAAPSRQVPLSGPPLMAPVPSAVIVCPKPANGAVGAVQVVVVVAVAPVPEPAVPTAALIEAEPVEPIAAPPVKPTVLPAAGV